MKKSTLIILLLSLILLFAGIYLVYDIIKNPNNNSSNLMSCSKIDKVKDCSEGFICYDSISQPKGSTKVSRIGGDQKCHKSCLKDSECPNEYPSCLMKDIAFGDYYKPEGLCF